MEEKEFPKEVIGGGYGFFGYKGWVCDRAIYRDDPTWLQECIDRGYIDSTSILLGGQTVRAFCEDQRKTRCSKLLSDLDWPLRPIA